MAKSSATSSPFTPPSLKRAVPTESTKEQPRYEVVDITPDLAEKWLNQNTHNRNIRERAVDAYARDMAAGKWAENGEAIKFADDGTLLDGQHRLYAVVMSGQTVRMLVVTGLPRGTQETMDDGRKRTLADALNLRGESHAVVLAAATRRALMWERGITRNTGVWTPTNTECLTFLDAHPELRESAVVATSVRLGSKLPASVLSITHWVFTRINAADAEWFFGRLGDGADLPMYHPIWTLRKRVAEESSSAGRVPEDLLLAFVIKAWNAYRDGSEMRLLRFVPGGATPERFPMPK